MGDVVIKNIDELLMPYLGPSKNVVNVFVKKLPPAGVGSIMLKVELVVRHKNGSEEKVYAVAKTIPATEMARKVFKIQVTAKNEIAFYDTVLPTLRNFQEKQGVTNTLDTFAELYGARINLDRSDDVTEDAVLLLEDLTVTGFQNISRHEGFDLSGARLLLKDLATFQGTVIALKLKEPGTFENKIELFCRDLVLSEEHAKIQANVVEIVKIIVRENQHYADLSDNIFVERERPEKREIFATITHNDMWVNNSMQKLENGRIIRNKFVDWQFYSYESCVTDVFFFLWTSVKLPVLKEHFDNLLKYHYQCLIQTIKELNCDITPFSFDKYLEEVRLNANYELLHVLFFIFMSKNNFPISEDSINNLMATGDQEKLENTPTVVKETIWHLLQEYIQRKWI